MPNAYVVDAVRTPVGRYGGGLAHIRPDDLLAFVIQALLQRNPAVDPQAIEDVIAGDANQAGEDTRNVARMAALLAGLPPSVAGNTVNRLCASGLQAIMDASRALRCGEGDVYVAGGVESMSRAPLVRLKTSDEFVPTAETADTTIGWRFPNPRLTARYPPYSMGETADLLARQLGISREEQDVFALHSHDKYFSALEQGKFSGEIVPLQRAGGAGWLSHDEHPRRLSPEKLAALRPAFAPDGTVTAGNAAGLNDGAAALLLVNEEALARYRLVPMARVVSMAVAGVDPSLMGLGPVPAVRKALERAGLGINDIALVELNESFAVQSIACIRELGLDPQKVNVNGGSLAIGHPLGCSGARVSTTLLHEMRRSGARYGLAVTCVGLGQGAAVVYEGAG